MSLPTLSPEQREAALAKASKARRARAVFKQSMADRTITAVDALDKALDDETLRKLHVSTFLTSLPSIGKAKATSLMEDTVGCSPSRRLQGLGLRQVEKLRGVCADVDTRRGRTAG